jgi:hypothetical protein
MLRFGVAPYLECSSRGDRRFSAFYAQVRACGGRTIEDVYQGAKVFSDGSTGLLPCAAKGRRCVNQEEVRALYADLWDCYMEENPHLMPLITRASGLSDLFGQEGHACQAEELWRIRAGVQKGAANE